ETQESANGDHSFQRSTKQVISVRRDHPAIRSGEITWLRNSDEQRVISFLRGTGKDEVLVTINMSNRTFEGFVEVPNWQSFREAFSNSSAKDRFVGLPALSLDSWGFRIFIRALQ